MGRGVIVLDCGFDLIENAGPLACCTSVSSSFR